MTEFDIYGLNVYPPGSNEASMHWPAVYTLSFEQASEWQVFWHETMTNRDNERDELRASGRAQVMPHRHFAAISQHRNLCAGAYNSCMSRKRVIIEEKLRFFLQNRNVLSTFAYDILKEQADFWNMAFLPRYNPVARDRIEHEGFRIVDVSSSQIVRSTVLGWLNTLGNFGRQIGMVRERYNSLVWYYHARIAFSMVLHSRVGWRSIEPDETLLTDVQIRFSNHDNSSELIRQILDNLLLDDTNVPTGTAQVVGAAEGEGAAQPGPVQPGPGPAQLLADTESETGSDMQQYHDNAQQAQGAEDEEVEDEEVEEDQEEGEDEEEYVEEDESDLEDW
jgi:hypothetical protein